MARRQEPADSTRSSSRIGTDAEETRRHARAIELFHLAFMQVAAAQLRAEDYAVKGGGNLRFFLGSGRRSAGLDLDYLGDRFDGFRDRVAAVLTGAALPRLLKLRDIRVFDMRLRKDTQTTKRWLFKLARPGMPDATSKVEFSSRGSAERPVLAQADPELARKLGGVAVRLQHYPPAAAIAQKVRALRDRSTTEPRDVFDLDHLARRYAGALADAALEPDLVLAAAKIAEEIPYQRYHELVEPYLDEDIADLYSGAQAWFDMQLRVVTELRAHGGGSA